MQQVATSELRANLREWLDKVRNGEEILITDRGKPVARMAGVESASMIEKLVADGVLTPPERPRRFVATGRPRPTPRGSVSKYVSEQRGA